MDSFSIRLARMDERQQLEDLQWRASLANPGDRDALLANPDAIQLPAEQIASESVFVAERNGAIAGFAALLPRPDGNVELDGLFVDPDIRRCGAGRSLVEHCCQIARSQGATFLHVVGNLHAEDFYKACKFECTGMIEMRFGPALLMRRNL